MMKYIIALIILIILVLIYCAKTVKKEGLNITFYGKKHNIIRDANGNYVCFSNNSKIPCDSSTIHLYRQTIDPYRYCYNRKINNREITICTPYYPTRFD